MLKLILVVALILGICVLAMSVRIIFHRSHKFPETSVGHNAQMRKRGITCPKHDEFKCFKREIHVNCSACSANNNKE